MRLVCLDFEGVLVPEIWIAFSEAAGIPELRRTTRDEPDYEKLMRFRLGQLKKHKLRLPDIQSVIETMNPLEGAEEFIRTLREQTQIIILSDTFEEFAKPLMAKFGYPTLFCNSLECSGDQSITGYKLRQKDGKRNVVRAFRSLNFEVFASGDSFNDLNMIREAHGGCLFQAPRLIREEYPDILCVDSYDALLAQINRFLA
jgi:phosphoserine/homoserine phosphotransferase